MHCELIVPGLFTQPSGSRAPALELLLARGRASSADTQTPEAWLQEAFGLDDAPIAAGALTLLAAGRSVDDACWARADPVHLRLMRDRLIVVPVPALSISPAEAQALVEALNAHFAGRFAMDAVEPGRWCARLAEPFALDAAHPLDVAGRDMDLSLPHGDAGKRWHALLNEIQMLLHAHAVNEAREARGEPVVNSVWLWGGGALPSAAKAPWQSVAAEDPVARGLAQAAGRRARPLPESAARWLDSLPEDGRHLVLLDTLRAPIALGEAASVRETIEALEAGWFAPLLQALRGGRIGMVTLHVPDAGADFEVVRADLRRFWRRPRALERYA